MADAMTTPHSNATSDESVSFSFATTNEVVEVDAAASPAADEQPWAALHDESLTANERRRPNAKAHIGLPGSRAICGPFFLDEMLVWDPAAVPEWRRCQRPACRHRWPNATRPDTTETGA